MAQVVAVKESEVIHTVHIGDNSGLIKKVAELYFNPGDKIADVTYGKVYSGKKLIKQNLR